MDINVSSLFQFILWNYILTQHSWKVLHDLTFTRVQHYVNALLFNNNVNHELEGIYCGQHKSSWLGIEPFHLAIKIFLNYYLHSFNEHKSVREKWKTAYSKILAKNTKWVAIQLFGCGRAKIGLLRRRHFHYLMFIIELLLVLPVGHMDTHIIHSITKPSKVPWAGNQPTWIWCLNLQNHS